MPIHWSGGGSPAGAGLVFVHGGGAHAHWWTHVAASFAGEFRVLAIDLSGHGDSGHRRRVLTRAVDRRGAWRWPPPAGVAGAAGRGGPLHGRVRDHRHRGAARRRAGRGDRVRLTGDRAGPRDPFATSSREAFGRPRTYADGRGRTRTVPHRPGAAELPRLRHRPRGAAVAARQVDGGWQWKFDRQIFEQFAGGMRGIALPYLAAGRAAGWPCCARRTGSSPRTSALRCTRPWDGSRR